MSRSQTFLTTTNISKLFPIPSFPFVCHVTSTPVGNEQLIEIVPDPDDDKRVIIVGDIHGMNDSLRFALSVLMVS